MDMLRRADFLYRPPGRDLAVDSNTKEEFERAGPDCQLGLLPHFLG